MCFSDVGSHTSGRGKLCESNTNHGVKRRYVYDDRGRPLNTRTDIVTGPSMATAVSYDINTGRLLTQTYPTGLQLRFEYTAQGYFQKTVLNTAVNLAPLPGTGGTAPSVTLGVNTVLWEALTVNARGQTELSRSANGVADLPL